GLLNTALQITNVLPGFNLAKLPVSVHYRNASTSVTVGQFDQIVGSGDVTITASSTADATGQAIYSGDTTLGLAVAFMWGETDAEADVKPNAQVTSTGGNVSLTSTASSTAAPSARISQNLGKPDDADPNHVQFAVGVGVSKDTAHATVEQGATVSAFGNLDFEAK